MWRNYKKWGGYDPHASPVVTPMVTNTLLHKLNITTAHVQMAT